MRKIVGGNLGNYLSLILDKKKLRCMFDSRLERLTQESDG